MENEQHNQEKLNPWLHIWFKPRAVIRQELDKPNREKNFILIAIIIGILSIFTGYTTEGTEVNIGFIALIAILVGPPFGLIILYFSSWLTSVVGRWLGGTGKAADLRVSTVRGSLVTSIATILLSFVDMLMRGEDYFKAISLQGEPGEINASEIAASSTNPILTLLMIIVIIWTMIISLKSIGEAHGFSAWKALLTGLIIAAMIIIPIVLLVFLFIGIAMLI
ncbi:YIP1 family protein [Alkalicoccobacillus murimartini]|uniref:Yip1 domain-containing protein n=1 Tax=Alkalicoccobacillus murimartini TaxID=171685 RepID=A0ABT9YKP0_9BACI|nr:YIP1 family protein [Alkalicoccobacillus murimartini]MDQ0207599.1 hypothetical protein [Alkalicoccobacillus murimartini]